MAEQDSGAKTPVITIKKYANRRLYNTGTSTYVTLDDLAQMVKRGEDFTVQDAKSGDDITHSVLTQIIFEQESRGQNLLPVQLPSDAQDPDHSQTAFHDQATTTSASPTFE